MNSYLNKEYSEQELSDLKSNYINNKPFNHIIIDDFINQKLLEQILEKIVELDYFNKKKFFDPNEKKKDPRLKKKNFLRNV